ncbi:Pre-rRNA-processing protein TSR2, putative [Babesia bigemina]|uniref:Pre-rRNA-processing protein TSR2, putative n=1 Tax=Babesia bigemina TaxID=5866 RepID=A0A061DDC2_BABBI|nr:Pre-rRNA-processing protein TSR2, putative [Babesia bigemina]CDR97269.1 Pre-rRNA-processing protein TSR2, putative [Babesia bigemina]|eukprot:XP_012769455.1 Pre-rRNA-processing protein TSR2, putative [Babesia bigemina]
MNNAVEAFRTVCRKVMSCWTALNLAVDNGWGGDSSEQKREALITQLIDFCLSKKQLYTDEVEDLLFDKMQTLFNVDIEDQSEVEIARLLVQLHNTCSTGDLSFAVELNEKLTKCSTEHCKVKDEVVEASSGESDDDTEGEGQDGEDGQDAGAAKGAGAKPRPRKTEELEDGWTKVL